jgi:hypothetical protein
VGRDTATAVSPGAFSILHDLCGDTDESGEVTPGDGYRVLNYFGAGPAPASCRAANVNGDTTLTTSDGYHLLNYLGTGPDLDCAPCEF